MSNLPNRRSSASALHWGRHPSGESFRRSDSSGHGSRTLADFPSRNNSLNFIRLVLATCVIVSHAWPIGEYGDEPRFGQLSLGAFAVAGFFALSGWLITQSRMSSELPSYLWRRFCRIYPGYFVALIVVAFVFAPIGAAVSSGDWRPSSGFGYIAKNLTLNIRDWTVGTSLPPTAYQAWNGSLWTLRYEVACYIVVGVMITLVGRHRMKVTSVASLVVLTVGALVWQMNDLHGMSFLSQFLELAPFFFAGAVLFAWRDYIPLNLPYFVISVLSAAVLVGSGITPALAAMPLAYFCMWLGAGLPYLFQRIGRNNDISYGTYIYAFPVQQLLALIGATKWGVVLYILASVSITLPLAAASWFGVERPAQRWRKALDRFPLVRGKRRLERREKPTPDSSSHTSLTTQSQQYQL